MNTHFKLAALLLLLLPLPARAGDTLTVRQCRELALQNSPLQQKKLLTESIAALQHQNIRNNSLPRISAGAQASWQSDVFGLPIDNPLFKVPEVPKDQYKLTLDVSERLWDGGSDRYLRQQRDLERDLSAAQTDVDVYQLRETVTDLYFKVLLLRENEAILLASRSELENRLKQAEAQVNEGVALRSTADQLRIQILKTTQQIDGLRADQKALLAILAQWIGRSDTNFALTIPQTTPVPAVAAAARPEYRLFDLQQRQLQLHRDMLRLRTQPKVDLFAQGGIGRPNPFNFFETGFEPFVLFGVRAVWTPIDWGSRRRDAQVLDIQSKNWGIQRQALDQRLTAAGLKDESDIAKNRALLQQDDTIIALQEDIVRRADAQVKSGVMTATDYLAQLNLLTQSRLIRKTHEMQALQAQEMLAARWNDVSN